MKRRDLLSKRLASATIPHPVQRLGDDATVRPLGGELGIAQLADGTEVFATVTGRAILGLTSDGPKAGCAVIDHLLRDYAPEYLCDEERAGWSMRYREYICPVTGYRVDSEILRGDDNPTRGISLSARIL